MAGIEQQLKTFSIHEKAEHGQTNRGSDYPQSRISQRGTHRARLFQLAVEDLVKAEKAIEIVLRVVATVNCVDS